MASILFFSFRLKMDVRNQALTYVNDVNIQISASVNQSISSLNRELESMSYNIRQTTKSFEDSTQRNSIIVNYLQNRTIKLDFEDLIYITKDREVLNNDQNVSGGGLKLQCVEDSFNEKNSVSYDDDRIYYSTPVFSDEDEVIGVIVGIKNMDTMQSIIKPLSFGGECSSYILDMNKMEIVVECANNKYSNHLFLYLDGVPVGNGKQLDNNSLMVMMDGTEYIYSYDKMDTYDWVIITGVPANVMAKSIIQDSTYMIYAAMFGTLIILILLFVFIYKTASNHKRLNDLAYVDRITKGNNINAFREYAKKVLTNDNTCSVILVNVKNFKLFNIDLGKDIGDRLLKRIYTILDETVGENGSVTRYYADVFYILYKKTARHEIFELIDTIEQKMLDEDKNLRKQHNTHCKFVINFGVSYVKDFNSLALSFDEARLACRNRHNDEDWVVKFYQDDIHESLERQQTILSSLEQAIADGDIKLYLQPQIDPKTNVLKGAEALCRWEHPTMGMIYPNEVIPLLEANGDIVKLDFNIFEQACQLLSSWKESGKELVRISVNVSGYHFSDATFPEKYNEIAMKYDIPKEYLELELTETFFIQEDSFDVLKEQMDKLHKFGFKVSMDDFGSGISTLSMLSELDFDALKIDRCLTNQFTNPRNQSIIEAISHIAHSLHIDTVVEGVENYSQLEVAKKYNFDLVQGYIFSKPIPADRFDAFRIK